MTEVPNFSQGLPTQHVDSLHPSNGLPRFTGVKVKSLGWTSASLRQANRNSDDHYTMPHLYNVHTK